jgi:hypothetical protein
MRRRGISNLQLARLVFPEGGSPTVDRAVPIANALDTRLVTAIPAWQS